MLHNPDPALINGFTPGKDPVGGMHCCVPTQRQSQQDFQESWLTVNYLPD